MAEHARIIPAFMTPRGAGTDSSRRIGLRRFPACGALREWVVREASGATLPGLVRRVEILVPGIGPAWTLDRMLRRRLPPGSLLPRVGTADNFFRDLGGDLDPPFRIAAPLARELLLEEALLAEREAPDAPPGDPTHFVDPLLAFLDEQARDASFRPGHSAFETFAARVERQLEEVQETDEGAVRLLRLARWLRSVHRRYQEALTQAGSADPGSLRERLFEQAPALRSALRGVRVLAVGEDALRPADLQLLTVLVAPETCAWALPESAPNPVLPRGLEAREETRELPGGEPPARPQPTLFAPPPAPTEGIRAHRPTLYLPASSAERQRFVFRLTDREEEVRLAAALLLRFRDDQGDAFRGFGRCALAAQNPSGYFDGVEAELGRRGIPFATPLRRGFTNHPWVASLSDVLEFSASPGRLSSGLNLLRSPFFRAPELPVAPQRAADLLARTALDAGMRDTNPPEELPRLAARLAREAADARSQCEGAGPDSEPLPERLLARADALETSAAALGTLTAAAETLAPLRDPEASFKAAITAFLEFVEQSLGADTDSEILDTVVQTCRQAAGAAPPGSLAGGTAQFPRRLRRLLKRRAAPATYSGDDGVALIAATDACLGDYDFLMLLGLADADWPGPRPQNIFFPHGLLEKATRRRQAEVRKREIRLLRSFPGLPRRGIAFSRPALDDSFPVAASPFEVEVSEALRARDLPRTEVPDSPIPQPATPTRRVNPLATTLDRRAPSAAVLEGPVSPTGLDRYLKSPAQFFARNVLRLDEERPLADVPPPTERGSLLHDFLERGYAALPGAGLTPGESEVDDLLAFFRAEFRSFAEERRLSETERRTEERWLFGGEATPGALEWFLREEAGCGPTVPVRFEAWIEGEAEPAASGSPALRVHGRLDRLDRRPGGARRVIEYKSGRYYEKPLQARIYARILEAGDGVPTDFAIPYFGNRQWIGPDDGPAVPKQDAQLAAIREGLAQGAFPPAPEEDGKFDFPLVIRRDLPESGPEAQESGGDARNDA